MDTLKGSVERVTFYNPENGYSVLRLRPDRKTHGMNQEGMVTVVGNLPDLSPGEYLDLDGSWLNHPKHGLQFQVEICRQTLPATLAGIRRYMGSGLVKGIGSRLADRIVAHFGLHTLDVIENQPERLREVADIGPKRSKMIAAAWAEQKQVKEIMLFLHSHGISTNLAVKIYKQYGDESLTIVQNDPYRLARDIYGVGFKTADRIARDLGLPTDHPARIEAGVVYILNQSTDEGNVFIPLQPLVERSTELLEVDAALVPPAIERLDAEQRIQKEVLPLNPGEPAPVLPSGVQESPAVYGQQAVYLTPLYRSEVGLAERLAALAKTLPTRLSDLPPAFIRLDASLSEQQQGAIRTALGNPVSVLTGGPGTGKTTCLKALIAALESAQKRYALASPTGRAAKRLSQATGRPASTIHRLLGFTPGQGFKHNLDQPLDIDFLVLDEVSMLDLPLAYNLIKALRPGTHLLLVGDVDQLPSVGAGDVLRDVIASGIAPVTRLDTIFRQAADSHIITNAHRINRGEMPLFPRSAEETTDFYLFPAETAEEAGHWVQEVTCARAPQKFGLHPLHDIQVLAPMYRGPAGVHALNARLQAALNPGGALKPEKTLFGQTYRPGDKVMQIQNNYDKEVYNGDIGMVFSIDPIEHSMTLDFEGRAVVYDWMEADQITLAYAISIHKSQGSEFPAVVIPLLTQHYMMLQRNLLYTAITRARRLCILVGSRKAIGIAVRNNQVAQRFTALDWRLQKHL